MRACLLTVCGLQHPQQHEHLQSAVATTRTVPNYTVNLQQKVRQARLVYSVL